MAWRYDSWESYFYPETINPVTGDGTLRNLYDEHDPRVLARFEYIETTGRATELLRGDVTIPKTYDAAHMRAIHRHLFQDVYEWAGEYRTVNMSKQWPPELGRGYTDFLATERIGPYLDELGTRVRAADWSTMDRDEFAQAAADVFSRANFAHPFREGNGRSTKVFMEHVAEQSRFTLDFAQITPEVWNRASVLTSPDPGSDVPVPDAMVSVFRAAAAERTRRSTRGVDPAARSLSPFSASYPKSPRQAPGRAPGEPQQHPYRGPSGYGPHDQGMAR
jgi:cell filamentation protein